MIAWVMAALACTNLEPVPEEQPCVEVGYALARRTYECTSDGDLANARYEAFDAAYACADLDWEIKPDTGLVYTIAPGDQVDYYHCAFAIGELACELVAAYGDDFSQWMTASPACGLILEEVP